MFTYLKPLHFWCQKVLPTVYDESLSYYELLCKVVKYLNITIDDINEIKSILDIHDLDTLAGLIKVIPTTVEMKADQDITNGQIIFTLGYYEENDGGGSVYIIRNQMPTTYYELLTNGLFAVLLNNNNVNILQFGAKPNVTDDASATTNVNAFNAAINYCKNNKLYIPEGIYAVNQEINTMYEISIEMSNNAIIKAISSMNYVLGINANDYSVDTENALGLLKFNIDGGIIDCNNLANYGFICNQYNRAKISNLTVKNHLSSGIKNGSGVYCHIINCTCEGNSNNTNTVGFEISSGDNEIEFCTSIDNKTGFKLQAITSVIGCNAWVRSQTLYENSIAFYCTHNVTITNCVQDTMKIGVRVGEITEANHSPIMNIIGFTSMINGDVITTAGSIYVVYCEDPDSATINLFGLIDEIQFEHRITNQTADHGLSKSRYTGIGFGRFDGYSCQDKNVIDYYLINRSENYTNNYIRTNFRKRVDVAISSGAGTLTLAQSGFTQYGHYIIYVLDDTRPDIRDGIFFYAYGDSVGHSLLRKISGGDEITLAKNDTNGVLNINYQYAYSLTANIYIERIRTSAGW